MSDPTRLPDLASRTLGGAVLAANDELFAAKENLVLPHPALALPGRRLPHPPRATVTPVPSPTRRGAR